MYEATRNADPQAAILLQTRTGGMDGRIDTL